MANTKTVRDTTYQQWNSEHTLDFLYGNAPPAVIGSLAVVLVLAYTLWSQVTSQSLFFWTFSGIMIAALRLAWWLGYRSRKECRTTWFWLNSYRLMSLASGLLNGLAMWLFFDNIPAAYQLLIFFSIVGLTAAASGANAVDLPTFHLFMYSSCLLAITKLLSYGETTFSALSIMFVFYVLVMGRAGRQTHTTLQQNFKLTHTMHYRATHDYLVGLLNREEFENQFEIRLPLTRHGVAMLFLDLDNFKSLNDTLGHQAGDRALQEVADILVKSLRADDVVARLGGDEFVTFLFLDDIREIEKIAADILQGVNKITLPGQHDYAGLSASIGIAFSHDNKVMFSQLMRAADTACYESKKQGRNRMTLSLLKNKD